MDTKFYFPNRNTQYMFFKEFQGQISDGFWENSGPRDHYRDWSFRASETAIDEVNPGRTFFPRKDNYNFASKSLLECVGDRIFFQLKILAMRPELFDDAMKYGLPESKDQLKWYRSMSGDWAQKKLQQWKLMGISDSFLEEVYADESAYTYKMFRNDITSLKHAMKNFRSA